MYCHLVNKENEKHIFLFYRSINYLWLQKR